MQRNKDGVRLKLSKTTRDMIFSLNAPKDVWRPGGLSAPSTAVADSGGVQPHPLAWTCSSYIACGMLSTVIKHQRSLHADTHCDFTLSLFSDFII